MEGVGRARYMGWGTEPPHPRGMDYITVHSPGTYTCSSTQELPKPQTFFAFYGVFITHT